MGCLTSVPFADGMGALEACASYSTDEVYHVSQFLIREGCDLQVARFRARVDLSPREWL
jgi:hypothetical protein